MLVFVHARNATGKLALYMKDQATNRGLGQTFAPDERNASYGLAKKAVSSFSLPSLLFPLPLHAVVLLFRLGVLFEKSTAPRLVSFGLRHSPCWHVEEGSAARRETLLGGTRQGMHVLLAT